MSAYKAVPRSLDISEINDGNLVKILIATDCHLGYEETDSVIGEDSFITFEEVLTKAVDEEVDFILLGGDLFHLNNPSQKTMNKCIELLRQFTLGDKNINLELLSRAKDVFSPCSMQVANFLDENINIAIPVFSIHGNHDDPSGIGQQSSMDTLSSAGLVNYFGKWQDLNRIQIKPIVMRKGNTYLALYGLGHIKDDRLCRLFIAGQVTFLEPDVSPEKCIRILVLHQNRADRGPKRFISESFIPSFFDIVIWGHEHDCRIEPAWNTENEFFVIQPGSTVATSLCEGEAIPKHIGVLQLWNEYYSFNPIKLNTVRPFIWKSIHLSRVSDSNDTPQVKTEKIKEHCRNQIEEMIREANSLVTGHPKQPKLPLIRLRCEYSEESQLFNAVRFGQQFLNRVATPNSEIVTFKKSADQRKSREASDRADLLNDLKALYGNEARENQKFSDCVNRIVSSYFREHAEASLQVLNVKEMEEVVENFLDKGETDSINQIVERKLKKVMARLMNHKYDDEEGVERELLKIQGESIPENQIDVDVEIKLDGRGNFETVQDSDSGTDEYEPVANVSPLRVRKTTMILPKEFKDRAYEIVESAQLHSDSSSDEPIGKIVAERTRGGSRGRGRGRGRGGSKTVKLKSPMKETRATGRANQTKPLKFAVQSSIVYEDDDSD